MVTASEPAATPGGGTLKPQRSSGMQPLDYLRVLYKRRYGAAAIFLLTLLLGAVYTVTTPLVYEGSARVLIQAENPNVVSFKEVIEQDRATTDYYQTQYEILQSRRLARKTIDSLNLWKDPEFGGGPAPQRGRLGGIVTVAKGRVAAAVSRVLGRDTGARNGAPANELAEQSIVLDRFLARLVVEPVKKSRLVDVKFTAGRPALAADIASALARGYIEQNLELKFLASKEATNWLQQRLAEQGKQLEASELTLQRYRERNDLVSAEQHQNIVMQRLADLSTAVTHAKMTRIEKETLYNQLEAIQQDPAALDTFPAILSNVFIQQVKAALADLQRQQARLSEQLGDRHPELIRLRSSIALTEAKLRTEIANIAQSTANEYRAALAQERQLTAALEAQKFEALALNRKTIDYAALERDVTSNRQMFEGLLQRAKETGVVEGLTISNLQIVDLAEVPRTPIRPRVGYNLLGTVLAGFALAIVFAFGMERLDDCITSSEEIKHTLGLPFLGSVPVVVGGATARMPLLNEATLPAFGEGFRVVRANLLFSSAIPGPRSIVVTSAGPRDGKTLVSANLSIALASAGQRVVLIDADMRRPRVHELFNERRDPGLSNVLVGDATLEDVLRPSTTPGLSVMPAGFIPPNPSELLGSERFTQLLGSITQRFDWVVVDSPPVIPVADASIIANVVSGVVFVVAAEKTSRRAAIAALGQLESANARFVGAVVNYATTRWGPHYTDYYHASEAQSGERSGRWQTLLDVDRRASKQPGG